MKLLSGVLDNPGNAYMIIKRFTSETLLNIIYGKTFGQSDEDLLTLLHVVRTFVVDMHPFRHWVDVFPILDQLPDLLAPWRVEARRIGEYDYEVDLRFLPPRAILTLSEVLWPSAQGG